MKGQMFKRSMCLLLTSVLIVSFLGTPVFSTDTIDYEAPIYMNKSISDNKTSVLMNDTFEISYKFQPQDIPAKNILPESYNKHKDIVLVIDTSGSMAYDVNGNEISTQGHWGEWKEIEKSLYRNNSNYYKKELNIQVEKSDDWDERISVRVTKYDDYDYTEGTWFWKTYYKYEYYRCTYYQREWFDSMAPSRLDLAKDSAIQLLSKIRNDSKIRVALVEYNTNSNVIRQLTQIHNSNRYEEVVKEINDLTADGGTNTGKGMYEGYNLLDNNNGNEKYFIFLTDGIPTYYSYYGYNRANYYLGNENEKIGGEGNRDTYGYCLDYAKAVGENYNSLDINSYFLAFADNDAGNKLEIIANVANGRYKKALTGNALADIYEELGEQIGSDISIKDIYFEESFPSAFEIVSYPEHMKKDGNTVKGEFASINYNLNAEKTTFVAAPKEFKITLRAKTVGSYILDASSISYKDINNSNKNKSFEPIHIQVYEDKPPIIDAGLSNDVNNLNRYFLNVHMDEDASIQILNSGDQLIASNANGKTGDNIFELNQEDLKGNHLKIRAVDIFHNTTNETVPIIKTLSFNTELILQTQPNSIFNEIILNTSMIDRDKFTDTLGQYKKIIPIKNGLNILEIKATNGEGNYALYHMSQVHNLDTESPTISFDYIMNFIQKDQESYPLKIFVESDGTGSKIIETHFMKLAENMKSAAITDFSNVIGTDKQLMQAMTSEEVNESGFKENKDAEFIKHEKFIVNENGYYAVYAKDESGNEAVSIIRISNVLESLPKLF